MMATTQASLLKCEASLTALQTAFSRLDIPRSPWVWDHPEETISTVPEEVTYGESPGLRVV